MTAAPARPAAIWIALVTVYIVWGSTYLGIRVVVEAGIPPFLGMGVRFLVAGAILYGFLLIRGSRGRSDDGRPPWRVTIRELRATIVMAVLLLVLGNGVVAAAEQTVPSGLTALIIGAIPLWFVMLRVVGGERPRTLTWLGVLVGLGGLTAISLPRGGIEGVEVWGVLLIVFATLSWASGSFISPRLGLPRNGLVGAAYEMLAAGVIMIIGSVVSGEAARLDIAAIPPRGWVALAYLILVGSLLGYTAYVYALAHAPLSLVGTYAYVNPVVAVVLGWAILSESVTGIMLTGGALIVSGVALVVTAERPSAQPPSPEDPTREARPEPALSNDRNR